MAVSQPVASLWILRSLIEKYSSEAYSCVHPPCWESKSEQWLRHLIFRCYKDSNTFNYLSGLNSWNNDRYDYLEVGISSGHFGQEFDIDITVHYCLPYVYSGEEYDELKLFDALILDVKNDFSLAKEKVSRYRKMRDEILEEHNSPVAADGAG